MWVVGRTTTVIRRTTTTNASAFVQNGHRAVETFGRASQISRLAGTFLGTNATVVECAETRRFREWSPCFNERWGWYSSWTGAASVLASIGFVCAACGDEAIRRTRLEAASEGEEWKGMVDEDSLPVFTTADVAKNDGMEGRRIWMSYGGFVYDVTDFIPNHPGGSEKILMAAGSAIEPFWNIYRQHFASDLPLQLMEKLLVGRLDERDQAVIDERLAKDIDENDPYANEPTRHSALFVHSDTPMNAEVPSSLLTDSYITPAHLFYIRHHHPVPLLSEEEVKDFRLDVDLRACGKGVVSLSLEDLQKLKKAHVVATLQCGGNRRSEFNSVHKTSGTTWGQGAISTAKWSGPRLRDVLKLAGCDDLETLQAEDSLLQHVRFEGLDGMKSSVGIDKATSLPGDVIVAYEMNDKPLPRDHGFPLRLVVPGYAAVRSVKWLSRIEVAESEAEGPWQRGLNYKPLPPSVTDAKGYDLTLVPGMSEASLFSGITSIQRKETVPASQHAVGETVMVKASGWAWAGGGRNVVRVDVTGDGGKTWAVAELGDGRHQRFGRAWAWTFWTCDLAATVQADGSLLLASKAVDMAYNVQPEHSAHTWNVRGLGNNSWYRTSVKL